MEVVENGAVDITLDCTMRIPSNRMPKYLPPPMSRWAWPVLAALFGGGVYALATQIVRSPMIVGIVVATTLGLFLLAQFQTAEDTDRLRALAKSREGQSICEFSRDFSRNSVDTWIIRAVYEQLQWQLSHVHPRFPIRADDRLKEDLLLDDDDLDLEVALEVEQRTGRSLDDSKFNPLFGQVKTVRDLVMFFQGQPRSRSAI